MIKKCEFSKLDMDKLRMLFASNPPVLIIGSAISIYEPSSIPAGGMVTSDLVNLLFRQTEPFCNKIGDDIVKEISKAIPFEQLFEMCPDKRKAREILSVLCELPEPNQVHEEIAKLLIEKKIYAIITTNYDMCIEKAFEYQKQNVQPIVYESDVSSVAHVYFKIHGSCVNKGDSIIFDLKHETNMADWKRELLSEMVEGRYCIFIGYSGRDFEICPEIETNGSIEGILWCNRNSDVPSPNARFILEKNPSKKFWTLVTGDIADFVSGVFNIKIDVKLSKLSSPVLVNEIKIEFNGDELQIWALNILSVMGYAGLTLRCALELFKTTKPGNHFSQDIAFTIASTYYRMGDYRESIRVYTGCVKAAGSDMARKIAVRYDRFESRRTGLYLFSSLFSYIFTTLSLLRNLKRLTDEQGTNLMKMRYNRLDGLYSTLLRYQNYLSPLLKTKRRKLRKKVLELADATGDIGVKTLMGLDHLYDDAFDEADSIREIDRFNQLGAFFEEVISYRRNAEWKIRQKKIVPDDYDKLRQHRNECIVREIYPEVVKLSLLLKDVATSATFLQKCVYSFYGKKMLIHHWKHGVQNPRSRQTS